MENSGRHALISVTDKSGIVEFAGFLQKHGIGIYSTGGTAKVLRDAGVEVNDVSALTGFPEIMEGRVKTLHPKVFGGILARRDRPEHVQQAQSLHIPLFDFVVVNLYAFKETVARADVAFEDALEQIDIGGVALLRAAAKNYAGVAVITAPGQYAAVQYEMATHGGELSEQTRAALAAEAFAVTSRYDALIHRFLGSRAGTEDRAPAHLLLAYEKKQDLRYGENPHQQAALYGDALDAVEGIVQARQLQGKELSFNNIMDADAAMQIVRGFGQTAAVVIKHSNPCGAAIGDDLLDAYLRALATDRQSAFGGIVGLNQQVDAATAEKIADIFTELVIAPGFSAEALPVFAAKKNLRLLAAPFMARPAGPETEIKHISGGILLQDKDMLADVPEKFDVVTERRPSAAEWNDMLFGWQVVRWVKSNAVIFVRDGRTLGIGAGQMSRVDASRLAVEKARQAGLELPGSVVASDAFFPFADGVEAAAQAGAKAVIQPGGSIRDQEVIEAANRHGMAMVFTHIRHFRH